MIFYYPQAVEHDMGPTKVLPSSQYLFQDFGNPSADAELPPPHRLTCAAGTVVIAHYDLFHGATAHLGSYLIVTLQYNSTTLYQVSYHFR